MHLTSNGCVTILYERKSRQDAAPTIHLRDLEDHPDLFIRRGSSFDTAELVAGQPRSVVSAFEPNRSASGGPLNVTYIFEIDLRIHTR